MTGPRNPSPDLPRSPPRWTTCGRSTSASTPEFRRRAVELAREKTAPVAQIAKDLGISESCLRNWMARADVEAGKKEGLTSDERKELVQLRRDKRRLETGNEILRRAVALFAKEISPR